VAHLQRWLPDRSRLRTESSIGKGSDLSTPASQVTLRARRLARETPGCKIETVRILYGVVGEGMGHATRSRVVLEELVRDNDVHIVVSGRAREYLARHFANVHRIWGLTINYGGNRVRSVRTVFQNLQGAVSGWPGNVRAYFEMLSEFRPQVVVSDFESFSYLAGKALRIPVISLDNIQIINRCQHERTLLGAKRRAFELTRSIVEAKLPRCFHYLITTFSYPPVRRARTTLIPPVLRPEILGARSEAGEHLLVYQTATTNRALPEVLKRLGLPTRIYGLRRDLKEDLVDGNLTYRPFSEARFIEDLRTARAVVAGGGFTLMSEAVYLHKPLLSVPVQGQFEQVLNALYLQRLSYGKYAPTLTERALVEFLGSLKEYERALSDYSQDGNEVTFGALHEQLARAAEASSRTR
jgi:uncharacterized protein (TIGR00661 family)